MGYRLRRRIRVGNYKVKIVRGNGATPVRVAHATQVNFLTARLTSEVSGSIAQRSDRRAQQLRESSAPDVLSRAWGIKLIEEVRRGTGLDFILLITACMRAS